MTGTPPLQPRGSSQHLWQGPPLAGFRDRAEAALVDWAGPLLGAYLLQFPLLAIDATVAVVGQALAVLAAAVWAVYGAAVQGRTGQSPGKQRTGIMLLDRRDLQPIGVPRSVGRLAGHVVDALPCLAGFALPLVDPAGQTIADKLAGTVVVEQAGPPSSPPLFPSP